MRSCQGLTALEAEIARDLEMTAHPHMEWMVPRLHAGKPALDVLIVGAGQSGLVTAFGLMRERVSNILVIDRAPEGKEGPWVTFARMPTLRSPKLQTGPDLGIPSLTFQAWYEAQHGAQAFADMNLIPSVDWHEYLLWYRRILGLPVRNDVAATAIAPGRLDDGGPCLLVTLSTGEVLATRKLVLATGQDGTGEWWMPDFVRNLPADRRAHTCELDIDFDRLKGKVVAVLGAGASAMDNAAVALEHGAEVHLFTRRRPTGVQRFRWLTFAGFLRHMGDMPDLWRWRFMANILSAARGLSARHLRPRHGLSRHLHHARRARLDRRAHGGGSHPPGNHARAVPCRLRDLRHRHPPERAPAARARAFADKIAPVARPLHAAIGRGRRAARGLSLSRPGLRVPREDAGRAPWLGDIHVFGIGRP